MKCEDVRQFFREALATGQYEVADWEPAWHHLSSCPSCTKDLNDVLELLEALFPSELAPVTEACDDALIAECAELSEDDVKVLYPDFWRHLKSCPDCLTQLNDLRVFVTEHHLNEHPRLPTRAAGRSATPLKAGPTIWSSLTNDLHRLGQAIKVKVSKAGTSLALPALLHDYRLAPQPNIAAAPQPIRTRGAIKVRGGSHGASAQAADREGSSAELPSVGLKFPDPTSDYHYLITFTAIPSSGITLRVRILQFSTHLGVSGMVIELHRKDQDTIEEARTDKDGEVQFVGLTAPEYSLRVHQGSGSVEIPLELAFV